ncbi:MAG: hypothetical protein ACPG8W_07860 [Candidatus Promineifilaceae bacterium]
MTHNNIPYPFNLGSYSRPITTTSAAAQTWFDRGLLWTYGFNHEEAIDCFEKSAEIDPTCAIAYWGMAYAHGPFVNKVWESYSPQALRHTLEICYELLQTARTLDASPVETDLIEALLTRHPSPELVSYAVLHNRNDAFADAMRNVYAKHSEDDDVATIFVEAMMNRTPWQLWDVAIGEPKPPADTLEMMAVLEQAMQRRRDQALPAHSGVSHFYIHTMEMSPFPERALPAADALRDLVSASGHLQHMPAHIDVLCGQYQAALIASDKAIAADDAFASVRGELKFYTLARCHNHHLKLFAAMFAGQFAPALAAGNDIQAMLPDALLLAADDYFRIVAEAYYSMKTHALVRFGKWQMLIDAPLPANQALHCVTTAMLHYGKGVAYAATGDVVSAENQHHLFQAAYAMISAEQFIFNNSAHNVLDVAAAMLNGEIDYRKGRYDSAFAHLRHAATLSDTLNYTEPWAWMHPPRHALGALLLEQGHVAEAEAVYRADLGIDNVLHRPSQHPNNVWSLHGYAECLRRLHKPNADIAQRLAQALALSDGTINASCCCR